MKKVISLIILFWWQLSLFSQVPASMVYDARSDINQANQYLLSLKNFEQATEQAAHLKQIYDFAKKAEEVLSKVNRALSDVTYVQNVIERQVNQVRWYGYYMSSAKSFKTVSASQLNSFTSKMNLFMEDSKNLLKMAQLFLRDDYFKMSDADRIRIFAEIDGKMSENFTKMKIEYNHLATANQDAKIHNSIKNW